MITILIDYKKDKYVDQERKDKNFGGRGETVQLTDDFKENSFKMEMN